MTTPYTPQAGSLADRVCTWFRLNREEELRTGDLARKFDVPSASVGACLDSPRTAGLLTLRKDNDGFRVWAAGPNLDASAPAATVAHAPPPARKSRRIVPPKPATMPDPDAVTIDTDVPMPPAPGNVGARWGTLFARMDVAHSIVVPAGRSRTVSMLARRWCETEKNGRKFEVRPMPDGSKRLFRTA